MSWWFPFVMHNDLEPSWLIFLPMLQALALAMAYQSVTDHHKQRPPINNLGPNDSIPNPPTITSPPRLLHFWCHSNATFDFVVVTCDNSFIVDDMVNQVFFFFKWEISSLFWDWTLTFYKHISRALNHSMKERKMPRIPSDCLLLVFFFISQRRIYQVSWLILKFDEYGYFNSHLL